MDSKYNYCFVSERTDIGCKRQANEDNLVHFECPNGLVATVCDGMGGHVGGAIASQIAVDAIRSFLTENYFDNPQEAIGMAIGAANEAILARVRIQPDLKGMGATCVMLIVRDGKVYIGSVGDSRVYLIRSRRIMQLTKDQSFVQMLVDRGEITKEQAEHHPRKNEITNCLGIADMRAATVLPDAIIPEAGDCFLLCSDGLSGMVSDERIEHIVSQQGTYTSQQRVDQLVELARKNGGLDNITVQIVEFSVSPAAVEKKRPLLNWMIALVALLVVIAAGAGLYVWLGDKTPADAEEDNAVVDDTIRVTFQNVPFEEETKLYIIPGVEMDTVKLCANNREDRSEMIAKQENLFGQLQAQLKGGDYLEYRQDCYIISSFEKFPEDTLALVLQTDSPTYKLQVIREKKELLPPASTPEAKPAGNPAKKGKNQPSKPEKKDDKSNQVQEISKGVTEVTKVEEKDRDDLQSEDASKPESSPEPAEEEKPADTPAEGNVSENTESQAETQK